MNKNNPDIALVASSHNFPKPTRVRVLLHHPVHALGAIDRIRVTEGAHWVTANLQSPHPLCEPDIQACSGVLIDYCIQAAALRQYGKCTLVDSELSFHHDPADPIIHVATHLSVLSDEVLAYHCRLYSGADETGEHFAEAHGAIRRLP